MAGSPGHSNIQHRRSESPSPATLANTTKTTPSGIFMFCRIPACAVFRLWPCEKYIPAAGPSSLPPDGEQPGWPASVAAHFIFPLRVPRSECCPCCRLQAPSFLFPGLPQPPRERRRQRQPAARLPPRTRAWGAADEIPVGTRAEGKGRRKLGLARGPRNNTSGALYAFFRKTRDAASLAGERADEEEEDHAPDSPAHRSCDGRACRVVLLRRTTATFPTGTAPAEGLASIRPLSPGVLWWALGRAEAMAVRGSSKCVPQQKRGVRIGSRVVFSAK